MGSQPPKYNFLVVEDEAYQREFIARILSDTGYTFQFAPTCADGREAFGSARFDCGVIDLGLPDGNGLSLLSDFAKANPYMVSIILTGDASPDTIISTLRAGAFDYLTKPIDKATLRVAAARALAHSRALTERAELLVLLMEERDNLRARVEEATADLRQYATQCEVSNSRLRALLQLTQNAGAIPSEEGLLRSVFDEVSRHLPLVGLALCDPDYQELAFVGEGTDNVRMYLSSNGPLMEGGFDYMLAISQPEVLLRAWLEHDGSFNLGRCNGAPFSHPSSMRTNCTVVFFQVPDTQLDAADREFLDMCAFFVITEWERLKLLLNVARYASLGRIGEEMGRSFIQPLTAIRTAADFVSEAIVSHEAREGMRIIHENVERMRAQTHEFRRLSLKHENAIETVRVDEYVDQALDMLSAAIQSRNVRVVRQFNPPHECVLLNGTALARTMLDLVIETLRRVQPGGSLSVRLEPLDNDHLCLELMSAPRQEGRTGADQDSRPSIHLAERTIRTCGGTLSSISEKDKTDVLRVVLPRNATRSRRDQEHSH